MKKINATLTEPQCDRLKIQAKRRGVSVSEVLRNAVDYWLYLTIEQDLPYSELENRKHEAQSIMGMVEETRK